MDGATLIVTVCISNFVLGSTFRYLLKPGVTSTAIRDLVQILGGIALTTFAHGFLDTSLLLLHVAVPYLLMRMMKPGKLLPVAVMTYGLSFNILREYMLGVHGLSVHFTLMNTFMTFSSLAWSIADGVDNTIDKKSFKGQNAIVKCPGPLAYCSYTLGFYSVPFVFHSYCTFSQYRDFIEGRLVGCNADINSKVLKLFASCAVFYGIVMIWKASPIANLTDTSYVAEFLENNDSESRALFGFLKNFFIIFIFARARELMINVMFRVSEGLARNTGLGYRRSLSGEITDDVLDSGKPFHMNYFIEQCREWNKNAVKFFRYAVFQRHSWCGVFLTEILLGLWHGIRPGCFYPFVLTAVFQTGDYCLSKIKIISPKLLHILRLGYMVLVNTVAIQATFGNNGFPNTMWSVPKYLFYVREVVVFIILTSFIVNKELRVKVKVK